MSYKWWQSAVIYQIYPRSFQDSSGNGIGDLQGIIERLDYLNDGTRDSLGFDAIWISPFFKSPMKDHGYDVSDYCDVDPLFGDLDTFDRLLAAAHQRGIKVIIDYVPNHSSDQHPWFIASRSSKDNPQRDWYIWRDPKADGSPPNNWGSFMGGPAWTLDEHTGQYYLHQFVPEQPELNWRNPAVKEALFDAIRFWLDRGVDGFRMDVIGLIIKDEMLRDNPVNPNVNLTELHPNDVMGRTQSLYNLDQDDVHPILKEMRQIFDRYDGDRVIIGELWGPLDRWARYYGENLDEIHMPFNFRLMDEPWETAAEARQKVNDLEAAIPAGGWPNYVLGNHDRIRLATRFGPRARAAIMMLLTLRGTPTFYYGDELGIKNVDIPPEKVQDPQAKGLGAGRSRDVARTPMQWDDTPHAGFSRVEPWLPVEDEYQVRNVTAQTADPSSQLNLVKQLLYLRRGSAALSIGEYESLSDDPHVFLFRRWHGEDEKIVALNFSGKRISVDLERPLTLLLSTAVDRTRQAVSGVFELRPYEGAVFGAADKESIE
ncbi:MAG: alpha-amylase family glycosyl hydrolase [Ardenticatenaceae bacterium]|nr:alpha-amylase family glycosyl hydrolase [Ardenticatenaceae bacterium]